MSSREEFEALMRANPEGWDLHECGGIYENPETQHDWEVWQASRQALVVELPAKISHLPHNQVAGGFVLPEAEQYDEAIDDCREAIEAAGVRVKP